MYVLHSVRQYQGAKQALSMSTVTSEKAFLGCEEWNMGKKSLKCGEWSMKVVKIGTNWRLVWTQLYKFSHVWSQKLLVKPRYPEPVKTYFTGPLPNMRFSPMAPFMLSKNWAQNRSWFDEKWNETNTYMGLLIKSKLRLNLGLNPNQWFPTKADRHWQFDITTIMINQVVTHFVRSKICNIFFYLQIQDNFDV